MKKLFFVLFFTVICKFILADTINISNNFSHFGPNNRGIILQLDRANIKGTWADQVSQAAADKAYIGNNLFYRPLGQTTSGYPWAFVGYKIYLSDDNGNNGSYLGYLGFTIHGNLGEEKIITDVKYSSSGIDPSYSFQQEPSVKYLNGANFEVIGSLEAKSVVPPIITNSGWASGMGNTYNQFTPGASFWVQDYGMNEVGRWTVDGSQQSIKQSTQTISGSNVGSRAYPVIQNSDGTYAAGVGSGFDGVWQIDIKIGSDGYGPFCETFYLAERKNLAPGPQNYMDGSGEATGGIGREIDILETRWHPLGPQINLPKGGGSSWNENAAYQSVQMANWSDVGGAPTQQFITFGAFIKDDNLWLYAYKPDGTLWYSTQAIPRILGYKQNYPFVPYIGTWGSVPGNFYTEYKNYIYLPASKIQNGINPKDNPKEFFEAVHAASTKN
ncbi:MAG: hypothetical protein ACK5Z5_10310 [Neisseriaceae bacterium]